VGSHVPCPTLITPIMTLRFNALINTSGMVHNLSPWVSHYEICKKIQDINRRVCACSRVSANNTQFNKPPSLLRTNDIPNSMMIGNRGIISQQRVKMNFSYNTIPILFFWFNFFFKLKKFQPFFYGVAFHHLWITSS
jgi:hypothetical protein